MLSNVWTERDRQFSGTRRDKSPGEFIQQVTSAAGSLGLLILQSSFGPKGDLIPLPF